MSIANIDLRKVRHAILLAECRSYVAAADKLNMTQSALSRSIQTLEATLAVRLFDRERGGVEPTAVGQSFLDRAGRLLNEAQELGDFMSGMVSGEAGEVAIGFGPLPASLFLVPLLKTTLRNQPRLAVAASIQGAAKLCEDLRARKIDFAVCAETLVAHDPSLVVEALGSFSTAMLVRANHPLATQRNVPIGDILKYPLISGSLASETRPSSSLLRRIRPSISCDDFSSLKELTLISDAVWWAARANALTEMENGNLVALDPADKELHSNLSIALVSLRHRTASPAATVLRSVLTDLVKNASDVT